MKKLLFILLAILPLCTYAQSDKEKAFEIAKKAISKMDEGHIKEAISLLEESKKLDPENSLYPYEIAYAHYLDKKYKESIKILEKLKGHPDANDRVYQMLGNSYDMDGKPEKAISIYEEGLKQFPNSGVLYLESGNMEIARKDYSKALNFYESGIEKEPTFPSNYYWASKIYLSSTEEVWGMLYGEIFMNLERNTARTEEISKLLYDTYTKEIKITSDTSFSVSFSQYATLDASKLTGGEVKLPFGIGVYEPVLMMSVLGENAINLASLNRIRNRFVQAYFENGHSKKYPNVLFSFQKDLLEKGHLDAYNHWILMKGDIEGFNSWVSSNKEQWDSFIAWFSENPIYIDEKHKFSSNQY